MAKRNSLSLSHILGLLLLCFVIIDAEAASPTPSGLSYPNCDERCGEVTIPFPYGMGRSECFLNEWYEVECRSGAVPYLKSFNLRVVNISFPMDDANRDEGTCITVYFPITYSNPNCTARVITQPPSLQESPFAFSTDYNIFVAVGCGFRAVITNDDFLTGCFLQCGGADGNSTYSNCFGFESCCTTAVPLNLWSFKINFTLFDSVWKKVQQCIYASLVDKSWLEHSPTTGLQSMKMQGYAPVVLDWGVPNTTIDVPNRSCDSKSFQPGNEMMQCVCERGYRGSPYIIDGCRDIDECKEDLSDCQDGERCVNTLGGYHCVKTTGNSNRALKLLVRGLGIGIGVLLLVVGWWLYKIKREEVKLKQKYFKRNGGLLLQQHLSSLEGNIQAGKLFNEKKLRMATENFSEKRILGKGGQGTVYKGILMDGRIVAIKKALVIDEGKVEQFVNEVIILSQINYRNIVKLLGCCLETEIPLLVYEFIPNRTLYEYLHESNKDVLASWDVRLQLATEIAGALFYLHSAASMPIYHRDIKSTNILLDEKYQAKIADFGTSRSLSLDQTHVTTIIQGTFGYLDPEYFETNQFTDKSDVYSFGVVLVELLTRQKPISILRSVEARSLAAYFIDSMENGYLFDILDAQFAKQGAEEEILVVANIAKRCLDSHGRNRPTMKEVLMELDGIKKVRYLSNFKDSEKKHIPSQYSDISTSTSTRLDADASALTHVHPLLLGRTW